MWKCKKCGGKVSPCGVTPISIDKDGNIIDYCIDGVICESCGTQDVNDIGEWEG